ncbi:hypothetical protein HCN44_009256 [Aphidius gifuensis]|uniref:Uncharacterized protein n=2 Tax=Aphidius gifuensis TaxID=684658 RepID=A0A834Y243_APHGI|nr:hypothetical protein HCN44_009256 [Aphidius gifuensis]
MHEWSACHRPESYWRSFVSYLINSTNDEQINKYLTTINSSFLKNCEDIYRLCVNASNHAAHDKILLHQIGRVDILESLKFDGTNITIDFEKIQSKLLNKFPYSTKFQQNQMSSKIESLMQSEFNNIFRLMQNDFPFASQAVIKEIAYNTLLLDNESQSPPPPPPLTPISSPSTMNTAGAYNYYTTGDSSINNSWSQQSYQPNCNNYVNTNYPRNGYTQVDNNSQQNGYVNPSTSGYVQINPK